VKVAEFSVDFLTNVAQLQSELTRVKRLVGETVGQASSEQRSLARETDRLIASLEREAATVGKTRDEIRDMDIANKLAALSSRDLTDRADRLRAAQMALAAAQTGVVRVNGQSRAGFQQLSFQLGDVATQYASGTSAAIIFAQQSGQVVQAIGLISGGAATATTAFGRFIGFLGGPWGQILTAGAVLISAIASSSDKASDAQGRHQKAAESLTDAIAAMNEQLGRAVQTQEQERVATLNSANAKLADAQAERTRLDAYIATQEQRLRQSRAGFGMGNTGTFNVVPLAQQLAIEKLIEANERLRVRNAQDLAKAQQNVTFARIPILQAEAAATERVTAATQAHDRAIGRLNDQLVSHAISERDYVAGVTQANAVLKAAQDADKSAAEAKRGHTKELREHEKAQKAVEKAAKEAAETADRIAQQDQIRAMERAEATRKLLSDLSALNVTGLLTKGSAFDAGATTQQINAILDARGPMKQMIDDENESIRKQNLLWQDTLNVVDGLTDVVGGDLARAISGLLPLLDRAKDAFKGTSEMAKLAAGAGIGGVAAGAVGGNALAGAAGGALGGKLGSGLTSSIEKLIPGLGQFAGPIGSLAGGLLGGVVGGLFSKTKKASATIEVIAGEAMTASISGNSSKLKAVAGSLADSLIGGLTSIADQLGGSLTDSLRVSIGQRKDTYRVDLTGAGRTKNMPSFKTEEEAVAYAIQSVIQRGAITGLSAAEQTLLKGKGDLQTQLQKALSFQGVFDELKQRTDPVGYAMDQIAKEFDGLNAIFKEAGASADDYAKLQQLRTLKEQEAQAQAEKAIEDNSERLGLERQLLEAQNDTAALRKLDLDALLPVNRALQEQIWALQDQQAAAAAAAQAAQEAAAAEKALADQRTSLQRQIMELEGRTAEIRALDLAAMDASLRPLQERIWALQDEAAAAQAAAQKEQELAAERDRIAQQRYDLETTLLQLQDKTAELRARELAQLDPSNRALQELIWKLQDQKEAAEAAAQAEDERKQAAEEAERARQQAAIDAANKAKGLADAWRSVGDSIMDEINRIRGITSGGQTFASLQGQFNAAITAARAGDQAAASSLPGLSQSLLEAAANAATSRQELDRIQAQTAAQLETVYALIQKATNASDKVTDKVLGTSEDDRAASNWWSSYGKPANDQMIKEMQALRKEVVQLRDENAAGHAANASANNRTAKILDNVTSQGGGDTISIQAAA
jgi:hypothetical protein